MTVDKAVSRRFATFFTEDWLAVAVGLVLVGLVLAGILNHIP